MKNGMTDLHTTPQSAKNPRSVAFKPTVFGRYLLIDQISKGGMSDIFLAKTVSVGGFHKPLVIKRLLPEYTHKPRYVKRFINEARTLARLSHSNIVQILDMGVIDHEYYIALEYIEGRNVAHVISKATRTGRPIPLDFCLHVTLELTKGLDYSHRRKGALGEDLMLVHQDVNSFNVMVSYEGEVKIIDFGIARIFLDRDSTKELPVAGKLLYFSPEQLQGKQIDRRVDVYGVGALLYELVTGERLIQHQETVSDTVKLILEMDVQAKVESDDRIPANLKPMLVKAMAQNPADRYSWAYDFAQDLRAFMREAEIDLQVEVNAGYMKDLFQRENLIDRRRMRRLLAASLPAQEQVAPAPAVPVEKEPVSGSLEDLAEVLLGMAGAPTQEGEAASSGSPPPQKVEIDAGREIFLQGEPDSFIYVISKGRVRLFLKSGLAKQTVAVLGEGDFFGESALLEEGFQPVSAETVDDCTLIQVDRDAFSKLFTNPLHRKVMLRLIERLRDAGLLLAGGLFEDTLSRFIYGLIWFHRRAAHKDRVKIDMKELADLFRLGDSSQIKKYLDKLRSLDILTGNEEVVEISNLEKLDNILTVLSGRETFSLKL